VRGVTRCGDEDDIVIIRSGNLESDVHASELGRELLRLEPRSDGGSTEREASCDPDLVKSDRVQRGFEPERSTPLRRRRPHRAFALRSISLHDLVFFNCRKAGRSAFEANRRLASDATNGRGSNGA
jgi:hypothetical protein